MSVFSPHAFTLSPQATAALAPSPSVRVTPMPILPMKCVISLSSPIRSPSLSTMLSATKSNAPASFSWKKGKSSFKFASDEIPHPTAGVAELFLEEGQKLSHTGSWMWNLVTGELKWSREHFFILGADPEHDKPSTPL